MDKLHWQKIRAYMALTSKQRRAADRAEFKYLPTPGLLEKMGYWEEFVGLWQFRPLPAKWPLWEVAFYSKSGFCDVSYAEQPNRGSLWSKSRQVRSDEQLLQFLQELGSPLQQLTLAQQLAAAGYRAALHGKLHPGPA